MNDVVSWFVSLIPRLFNLLNNMQIVSGVSLLGFLGGFIVIGVVINQLIRKAG